MAKIKSNNAIVETIANMTPEEIQERIERANFLEQKQSKIESTKVKNLGKRFAKIQAVYLANAEDRKNFSDYPEDILNLVDVEEIRLTQNASNTNLARNKKLYG